MHTNFQKIRHLLESRLKEATQTRGSRELIRIQQVADPIDMTAQAAEIEMATQTLDRDAKLVGQIRLAIDRVENGTYGICRECEEEIAQKRLKAIPWAELCIHCQEAADRSARKDQDDTIDSDYRQAA